MLNTPILFLVFNRAETTRRVFDSIKKVQPKQLFIAADGPRINHPDDIEKCAAARNLVMENIDWDCEVKTLFRDQNFGCGLAPAEAITWFFNQVEQGIILEDDCLPSQTFFIFCEQLLERYKDNEAVMHISGNNFQFGKVWGNGTYYFSRYINAWGWATWRRAWKAYDFHIDSFSEEEFSVQLKKILSTKEEINFWMNHFNSVKGGARKDIWDYQWVYTCWKHDGLAIIPNVNLVSNIGFGPEATHTFNETDRVANQPNAEFKDIKHPSSMKVSFKADRNLFHVCHKPKLTLRDKGYLLKTKLKNLAKLK